MWNRPEHLYHGPPRTATRDRLAVRRHRERTDQEHGGVLQGQLPATITWLLSDDASNVNGVVLPSDGGWSAI